MDVVNAEQAKIAEAAGACAVMALERVPADIRAHGGVARSSDPQMIKEIRAAVTIPVMAKVVREETSTKNSDHDKCICFIARCALATLWRRRSWRRLESTLSTRARSSRRPMVT